MSRPLPRSRLRAVLALVVAMGGALAAAPAAAQFSVTLYAGVMGSTGLDNATSNTSAEVKSGGVYGVALGTLTDGPREIQLLFAQQSTSVAPGGSAAPLDLTVRYLHLGGTVFVDGAVDRGFYAVGGLGATQFAPNATGYGNAYKASINLGLGYYWPLTKALALRAEARGFGSFVNSAGGFLCSGGCVVVFKSDVFVQYAGLVGLTASF